jgi:hypothetical protein
MLLITEHIAVHSMANYCGIPTGSEVEHNKRGAIKQKSQKNSLAK